MQVVTWYPEMFDTINSQDFSNSRQKQQDASARRQTKEQHYVLPQ